jgi:transporter family protein
MQAKAFLFALVAAFFWGAAPIFGKVGLVRPDPTVALALRSFVISFILLIWAALSGNLSQVGTLLTSKSGAFIAAEGILASLMGHLAYYYALKYGEASRMVPITSSFPLFALFLAILFLGERLSWEKILGAVLIVAGIFLIKR